MRTLLISIKVYIRTICLIVLVGFVETVNASEACISDDVDNNEWVDQAYDYANESFCGLAVWFDDFFENGRADEELRAGSRVRWRNDFIFSEEGGLDYVGRVSAKFKLPKASKRIKLVFESEEEQVLANLAPEKEVESEARADLGILYEMFESPRAKFSIRFRLTPKLTLRYRYTLPTSETFITRFTQEIFREDNVDGATIRIDFEKRLSEDFVLRWSNAGTVQEDFDGTSWSTGLVLFQHLTAKSALSYESGVTGISEPVATETNYQLALRYRRNVYRKWLFYELVPAVTWPLDTVNNTREDEWTFLFRLEVNFDSL